MIGIAVSTCGIKSLFGSIGIPSTDQPALDIFKSEAEHRLGFFVPQRLTPHGIFSVLK